MVSRWVGLPVVLSTLVLCTYVLATMWSGSPWNLTWKIPTAIMIFLVAVLSIDSSLGMVTRSGDTSPSMVTAKGNGPSPRRLFLLFHGYNGRGENLVEILGGYLVPYGTVVAFQPSLDRSNNDETIEMALRVIDEHQPDEVHVYGESLGGITSEDLLRRAPWLRFKGLTLNAMPSRAAWVKMGGNALKAFNQPWLYGGPISTWVLRKLQEAQVGPLPKVGAQEETVAHRADRASLSITGPMAFGQLGIMGSFKPTHYGEFAGRVDHVRSIHAPGPTDDIVDNAASFADIAAAFPGAIDHAMPWPEGEHTPTPRRGEDVARQILIAAGISS